MTNDAGDLEPGHTDLRHGADHQTPGDNMLGPTSLSPYTVQHNTTKYFLKT